jgi:hypothetical protein
MANHDDKSLQKGSVIMTASSYRRQQQQHPLPGGDIAMRETFSMGQQIVTSTINYCRRGRRRRREQQHRLNGRQQLLSIKKLFFLCWLAMGFFSYGILGWLFLAIDEESRFSVFSSSDIMNDKRYDTKQDLLQHEPSTSNLVQPQQYSITNSTQQNGPLVVDEVLVNKNPEFSDIQSSHANKKTGKHGASKQQINSKQSNNHLLSGIPGEEQRTRDHLDDQGFGWIIIPACMVVFLLLSVHRVREEDRWMSDYTTTMIGQTTRTPSAPYFLGVDDGSPRRYRVGGGSSTNLLSVLDTLAFINEDRIERGEPTVSLDSYLAFQQVLSDHALWLGLAERYQIESVRQRTNALTTGNGLSQEQFDALCPEWAVTGSTGCTATNISKADDDDGNDGNRIKLVVHDECSICLGHFEINDRLRTLPCHHIYHKACIDRWIQQSSSCPMCKRSLHVVEEE